MEVGEFALKVGVTQSVKAVFKRKVSAQTVMDEEVFKAGMQAHAIHRFPPAFGIEVVAGELIGAENVQPIAFPLEGAAGFIGVENGSGHEGFTFTISHPTTFMKIIFSGI
jgi:hypothetical protein